METNEGKTVGTYFNQYRSYVYLTGIVFVILILGVVIFLLPGRSSLLNPNIPGFTNNGKKLASAQPPAPTFTPIPTPTPVPLVQGPQTYTISNRKTPSLYEVHFNTIDPKIGETQTTDLKIRDKLASVTAVTALVKTDKKQHLYTMTLSSGTAQDGTWHGEWTADDTHNLISVITFSAKDDKGNSVSVDLTIR